MNDPINSEEHNQETETLDLSKSADSQEKFRSKRFLPWEVVIAFLYVTTVVGFLIAVDKESYALVEFWVACVLFLVFGIALVVANYNNLSVKEDNEKRRAIMVSVLEGSRGMRAITDPKDRLIYANTRFQAWLDELGVKKGKRNIHCLRDLLGNNKNSLRSFDDLVTAAKNNNRGEIDLPFTMNEKSGWIRLVAQPIAGWNGFIHWRCDDISVDRMMEEALKSERKRLLSLMDNAPIGFFSVDENGAFIFANETLKEWLAVGQVDLLSGSHHLADFIVEGEEDLKPYDMLPSDDPNLQRGEVKLKALDGRIFIASVTHVIVKDDEGHVHTRSVIRDLTPEHEWRRALKQSEDRFQRFFEEAPLGIALIDNEGRLTECNDSFAAMTHLPYQKLLGQELISLLKEESYIHTDVELARIRDGQIENTSLEVVMRNPDSKDDEDDEIIAQMFAARFMGDTGIVLHFIDITAQKNLEKQFTQSQKMQAVGQLAGGIAHDFNNLLTAMIGFCDLLMMRHKAGDPSFSDIMQIKQNANRAANLVRQLLAFSRQQQLQPKIIDITDVITEITHLLRRLIGANIELKITHARDLGLAKVDQGQLEQVLINLAVNARDAMKGGGQLTIKTYNHENKRMKRFGTEELPAGQWVVIEVSDTGHGIPEEIMERIFDPFFSTKEVGAGTGLGLSTVYGIVKQTDGHVFVESELEQGAKFMVYLPRMKESEVRQEAKKEQESARQDLTGSARILLVEDEDAVRSFSARALSNKGYQVFEAASGELAVERLEEEKLKIDMLVTDVIMPNMDGIQLSKIVKEKFPNVPVVFMSGYTEDRFKDEIDDTFHFLQKPFTLKQLAEKVKAVLEEK